MKRVKFGFESMFLVYDFKILPKRDIEKPHFMTLNLIYIKTKVKSMLLNKLRK